MFNAAIAHTQVVHMKFEKASTTLPGKLNVRWAELRSASGGEVKQVAELVNGEYFMTRPSVGMPTVGYGTTWIYGTDKFSKYEFSKCAGERNPQTGAYPHIDLSMMKYPVENGWNTVRANRLAQNKPATFKSLEIRTVDSIAAGRQYTSESINLRFKYADGTYDDFSTKTGTILKK